MRIYSWQTEEPAKKKSLKPAAHIPVMNKICVTDLLCTTFVDVEEKLWRWYLLRRVAVTLEPYTNLTALAFGPHLLGQVAKTMATIPMQPKRGGESVPSTEKYRFPVRALPSTIVLDFSRKD
ncbi:MAG: hypothetical protein HOA14_17745 [Planctomycetaceae bacterium]|nr:hypothetical protein [Planctomycetaceae bacterium]